MQQKKNSFSGSIGFVLAAAGSAVGVGNIWRFPYLCAKDGGGLFLIIYLVLVLTFGLPHLEPAPQAPGQPRLRGRYRRPERREHDRPLPSGSLWHHHGEL